MATLPPIIHSLGLGVDSSAVIAAVYGSKYPRFARWQGRESYIATADLEVEWPETYDFRDNYFGPFLEQYGQRIHVLTPQVRDRHGETHSNLANYYHAQAALPSRTNRSCTERFKILTVQSFVQELLGDTPVEVMIGFDCNEGRRVAKMSNTRRYHYFFPMIDLGISRLDAAKILLDLGLPVPRRSACYSCSFLKSIDWWELSWRHPHLYAVASEMEENIKRERGREFYFNGDKPLTDGITPRRFKMPDEGKVLYEKVQHYLAHIIPNWPSYALCLAAQEIYGKDHWPKAVGVLKLGPARLDDPWQIYTRLQYCLEEPEKIRREWEAVHQYQVTLGQVLEEITDGK